MVGSFALEFMNTTLFAMLGWPEILGIILVVVLLFGARKIPDLARGLGNGIKEFKKATRETEPTDSDRK